MKNEEINLAIAELCGVETVSDGWLPSYSNPDNHNLEQPAEPLPIPNYCEDLNAMHLVVSGLGITWLDEYAAALCKVTGLTVNLLFLASARQMAEAYLLLSKKVT